MLGDTILFCIAYAIASELMSRLTLCCYYRLYNRGILVTIYVSILFIIDIVIIGINNESVQMHGFRVI